MVSRWIYDGTEQKIKSMEKRPILLNVHELFRDQMMTFAERMIL